MKLKNTSYIFLLLFFFTSCIAKKSTIEYKERIVKDSVYVYKDKEVIKEITDTLIVESPCDSLGNLKAFNKEIRTPKTAITLKSINGKIEIVYKQDEIITSNIKEVVISSDKVKQSKDVDTLRYRYPLWLILTALISVLLNIILLKSKLF